MKREVYLLFIVTCIISLVSLTTAAEYTSLYNYYSSLEDKCRSHDDCVVRNVRNCCGYYPKCVNINATLDSEIVEEICFDKNESCTKIIMGYCRCQVDSPSKKRCIGHVSMIEPVCGDGNCYEVESYESNESYCPEDCGDSPTKKKEQNEVEEKNQTQAQNKTQAGNQTVECPPQAPLNCPEESEVMGQGKDENGCPKAEKCVIRRSDGSKKMPPHEVKIMPDTASARAIERLGELNFSIELKEVGKGDKAKAVYELTGKKSGRFLGIFKIQARVTAQVDAEDGKVKVIKPWWAFLVAGV